MSDIIDTEPIPAGGNVNSPASGTYGEKASLARLEQDLPHVESHGGQQMGGQGMATPPGPGPSGPMGLGGGGGESPIPGVPGPIFDPTARPDIPVDTPFVEPETGAVGPTQGQLRVLDALKMDEDPEVVEWATMVLDYLIELSRQ